MTSLNQTYEHCWHSVSGLTLDMLPPVHPVQCCWCGRTGGSQTFDKGAVPGHGLFHKGRVTRYTVDGPCEERTRNEAQS